MSVQDITETVRGMLSRNAPLFIKRPISAYLHGGTPFVGPILRSRAIFIHVPKTGGSSIKTELYGRPRFGHRAIGEFHRYDPEKTRDFFKFCFVRNPWDRLLSAFSYLKQGKGTTFSDNEFSAKWLAPYADFDTFVQAMADPQTADNVMRYHHFRLQASYICLPGENGHAMDFVGRLERIDEDLDRVRERLGLPRQPLRHALGSEHPHYRDAYTSRTRTIVGELYARDIALLGYAF